jgi:hypothetical protein
MDASVDVGLGTAYERVAVYRMFDRWFANRPVATAFEGPLDNMAGIPGIHLVGLARRGAHVTVGLGEQRWLDNVRSIYVALGLDKQLMTRSMRPFDPLPEKSFDLVLSYNVLPIVDDWRRSLEHVATAARRWLVVALTNPFSYGVGIRKTIRVVEPRPAPELFDHPSTRPETIEPALARLGSIEEHAYFDCPWWPDLFVDAGESLLGATLKRLPGIGDFVKRREAVLKPAGHVYGADDFPFFDPRAELNRTLSRHPVFDDKPTVLARAFGHLHAYLVRVKP